MTDELRVHWTLHEIDEEAARHEAERAKLPALVRERETRAAAERARLAGLDQRMAGLLARRRALERDIAVLEEQEKKYRAQLDAVTNQHQFEAVQHEIAGAHAKRSALETDALTIMDDEERGAADRPALAEALERAEAELAAARAGAGDAEAQLAAALGALDARRDANTSRLDPAARTRYEKIRAGRAGRAVAAVDKGACGACFRGLSPHALQESRRRDRLLTCEGCGRLLVLPPEAAAGS